jgi:outer membrane autotransporter protein
LTAAALPTPGKPITIDTGSFTLTGLSTFSTTNGNTVTLSGNFLGTDAAGASEGADGFWISNFVTVSNVVNNGTLTGGAGGPGGGSGGEGALLANTVFDNNGTMAGGAGLGTGVGGSGVEARRGTVLTNNANGIIQGGTGVTSGGLGVDIGGPGAASTLVNHGTIHGGNGGVGGIGYGVYVRNGTNPIVNTGTIEGGNGASAIVTNFAGMALNITNSGTIRAGAGQATAIGWVGGVVPTTGALTLELQAGSEIFGNVVGNAASANDRLRLGGGQDDTFDASAIGSQYQNFNIFEKTGASTWTLTGATSALTPWQLLGGTLAVSSDGALGDTAGTLTFNGGALRALSSFESTRNMVFASDGIFDTVSGAELTLSSALTGAGGLRKLGAGTLIQNAVVGYAGPTSVANGTLEAGAAGIFAGAYSTAADGMLDLNGFDQTIANFANGGRVRLGDAPGTTLTVTGNYVGNGGTVYLNTVLAGDGSPTDLLDVQGDISGTSSLVVNNIGGDGAQTTEGIKIVNVGGASNGTFSLLGDYVYEGEQAVVGGAYAYRLYKGSVTDPGDGDWYLRSELDNSLLYQAGVPVYEAYPGVLQSFNQLGTLQQRLGNRSWTVVAQGADAISEEASTTPGIGIWGQIEAGYGEFDPETSTTSTDYDVSIWKLKAGVDTVLAESASGQLIGGVALHYGTVSSDVSSIFGNGSIDATGYGGSGSLTWYSAGGFYADAQAQVTGYDSDLFSDTAGVGLVAGNNGLGYTLGVELGQRIPVHPEWALTPQAQLTWSSVEFDDFKDAFGAPVSLNSGDSLVGRLGLAVDRQTEWRDADGSASRAHVYGIGNLYYDLEDGTSVDVAGTPIDSEIEALWAGLGFGGTYSWADDKYALYGEGLAKTSLEGFGDSYALSGTVGFRATW